MMRPLRRVHRWMFLLLTILLPVLLAIAIARRAAAPVQPDWPFEEVR